MDGRPKRIKKFAFTSVCVYNRLRVDGALVSNLEATASKAVLGGLKFKLQNRVKDQTILLLPVWYCTSLSCSQVIISYLKNCYGLTTFQLTF